MCDPSCALCGEERQTKGTHEESDWEGNDAEEDSSAPPSTPQESMSVLAGEGPSQIYREVDPLLVSRAIASASNMGDWAGRVVMRVLHGSALVKDTEPTLTKTFDPEIVLDNHPPRHNQGGSLSPDQFFCPEPGLTEDRSGSESEADLRNDALPSSTEVVVL